LSRSMGFAEVVISATGFLCVNRRGRVPEGMTE
jgi:hypothetical protein